MPQPIPSFRGSLTDAFDEAKSADEPRFVPATLFADDRGWSYMNQFLNILDSEGQINFSTMYPGVIKAWHRHHLQTDFWMVLTGHLKVGVHDADTGESWITITGEKRPGTVVIPPPLWHGAATVGPTDAGLLYYVTHQYDPQQPDEERQPYDAVADFPWAVQHK